MSERPLSVEVPYGWVIIFASLLINTIGLAAPNILFVALKPIAADLGAARAVPSFAYALLMIGSGVGGIAMGMWMDRRGVMQPVMFGAVMIALGAFLASQSEGRWSLYVANGLLIGLMGKAAMIAPLIANATRWFDRRRGLAVAIIASGQGVAGAIWPPVVRYFNDSIGWRDTYLYFGVLVLVAMLPLALFLRPRPPAHPRATTATSGPDDGSILGYRPWIVQSILWVAVVGCCAAMAMPIVHLVSYATDRGLPLARAAELLSMLFIGAFVSRIAFGIVSDRIGAIPTLLFGSCCQAAALFGFAVVETDAGLHVMAVLFGLGFAGIMPCYALIIRLLFPIGEVGWRIAAQYLFAAMGMALGGWLGGYVYDVTGTYSDAFLLGVGFNLVNLFLVGFLFLRTTWLRPQAVPV